MPVAGLPFPAPMRLLFVLHFEGGYNDLFPVSIELPERRCITFRNYFIAHKRRFGWLQLKQVRRPRISSCRPASASRGTNLSSVTTGAKRTWFWRFIRWTGARLEPMKCRHTAGICRSLPNTMPRSWASAQIQSTATWHGRKDLSGGRSTRWSAITGRMAEPPKNMASCAWAIRCPESVTGQSLWWIKTARSSFPRFTN